MKNLTFETLLKGIHYFRCHDYTELIALVHTLPDFLKEHSKVGSEVMFGLSDLLVTNSFLKLFDAAEHWFQIILCLFAKCLFIQINIVHYKLLCGQWCCVNNIFNSIAISKKKKKVYSCTCTLCLYNFIYTS